MKKLFFLAISLSLVVLGNGNSQLSATLDSQVRHGKMTFQEKFMSESDVANIEGK